MRKAPLHFFEEISAIPRVSGNEAEIADYVQAFAEQKGYEVRRDNMHNLIVVKPASTGYEAADSVILQGHLDMVGEAKPDVEHDFAKDPIRLVYDGDILRAGGTTLGADDGVAVAYMLAVLDDDTLRHPRLECVFTTQEETGMCGALALDTTSLESTRMVNLDAGPEGVFLVSCAGGCRAVISRSISTESIKGHVWQLDIDGLKGGHSGASIKDEHANALVLAGLAADALRSVGSRVIGIDGGGKDNVIPAQAQLTFAMEADPSGVLESLHAEIHKTWALSEPNVKLRWKKSMAERMLDEESSDAAIDLLLLLPHGIESMSTAIPGLVECSSNMASMNIGPKEINIRMLLRSAMELRKELLLRKAARVASRCGATVTTSNSYPGWAYEPESALCDKAAEVYTRLYGKTPSVEGIHAGLECGLFKAAMPQLDIIATGPLYKEMHTPNEWLDIPSFNRTYAFLITLLEELGVECDN